VTAVLLILMGAMTALAAPAAIHGGTPTHVDGTFVTNKPPEWATAGSTIDINVRDADRNVTVNRTRDLAVVNAGGDNKTTVTEFAGGGTGVNIDLALDGEDEAAGTAGPTIISGSITADVVTGGVEENREANFDITEGLLVRGRFTVSNFGATVLSGATLRITYKQAGNDELTDAADAAKNAVKVSGTQLGDFTMKLLETTSISGEFTGKIKLVTTSTDALTSPPAMKVALTGDLVTITYTDKTPAGSTGTTTSKAITAVIKIDMTKPSITNVSPAHEFATKVLKPTFVAEFNDGHSGIDTTKLSLELDGSLVNTTCTQADLVGGAYRLTCTPNTDLTAGPHDWQFIAKDKAGVEAKSDSITKTSDVFDKHQIIIDVTAPTTAITVKTGIWWDPSKADDITPAGPVGDDFKGNKSELDASKAKKNSIRLTLSESLSAASVAAGDFTVAGNTITKAEVFENVLTTQKFVFLTLGTDLAPDAKPKVSLVGSVDDRAGNALAGLVDAGATTDGIGPKVTILSVDKTLIKDSESVVITIESDEGPGPSKVEVYKPGKVLDKDVTASVVVITSNAKWQVTVKGSDLGDSAAVGGEKKTVKVTVGDGAGNTGTKGSDDTTSASAVVFTLDDVAPTVNSYTPADLTDVFDTAPYVTVKWNEKVTITKAQFGVSGGTLDDITSKLGPITAGNEITYAASGLTVDKKYELKIVIGDAVDTAGNKSLVEAKVTFTVKARVLKSITVKPGQNLISLPSDPADTAINVAIKDAAVKSVITFDPLNPDPVTGPWKSATRGGDGKFGASDSLKTIDSKHAYWVNATDFVTLKFDIPPLGFAATPPTIALAAGWNLVPVVTITDLGIGVEIWADNYFASAADWVAAFGFEPPATWEQKIPKSFNKLKVGKGYWLYVPKASILIPVAVPV
jgi:hypothetical protein